MGNPFDGVELVPGGKSPIPPHDVPGYLCSVRNGAGRVFTAKLVRAGEKYGLHDCLTHDGPDMVEFYDFTYANKESNPPGHGFGPLGQFVSRYYASTLQADYGDLTQGGLCLDGGVSVWTLDARNMREVFAALGKA